MFSINYEELFEQNSDAIMIVNQEGFVLEANPALYDLSQFKREDVRNKNYETFFKYENDEDELKTYDQRMHFICKDQKSRPVLVRKVSGDDCFFVVIKDMHTLDKIAENYLQSELRYRVIAEHIQDVLILMDEHKNYLYVSPSALDMFQFDYQHLDNRSAFFNIHPDHVEQLELVYEKAIVEGNSFTMKVKAWHEEKQWIWTELKGKPMYANGKFQHMLLVARDVSSQHNYEEMLLQQAYSDALTNLPNRRKLNKWLKEKKSVLREQSNFAVMLMDIDNFKHINDNYGHEIGDYVLVEYGHRVSAVLEQNGIFGRYGGDEFMAVLPYERQQEVETIASQIVAEMQRPIEIQQTMLSITSSIGIALVEEDMAIRKMLKCADDALYKVKEQGKNGFYIVDVKTPILNTIR